MSSDSSPYRDNALLRGIPEEVLRSPDFRIEELSLGAGAVLFEEGDEPDYCYLVREGVVRISTTHAEGGDQFLALIEPGGFFGEMAMYERKPRSARAVAATAAVVGRVDQRAFDHLLAAAPLQIGAALSRRSMDAVRGANELIVSRPPSRGPAVECVRCGAVQGNGTASCRGCGGRVRPAPVPVLLAGKFRIDRRIGSGGMGVVYHAVDERLDREVAVKTLPRLRPGGRELLVEEARMMAAVVHPLLATIYGLESWEGVPMLIVEYLPRGTLEDRLREGPLPARTVLGLGVELARALGRLHGEGLLHRDIKPSNIGYAADGTPKLLDFGLAGVLETLAASAAPEVGSIPYLSPEAVAGGPPDAGWDVWALCMTLYEALAGRHPLVGGHPHWILHRISEADIPDLRSLAPGIPGEIADFFAASFARSPAGRARSASELASRLSALLPKLGA